MRELEAQMSRELIAQAIYRMDESTRMVRKCFDFLEESDIWRRPNPNSNSLGNQILHLRGNIGQYVLSALGGAEDTRHRDAEFERESGYLKAELLESLIATVEEAKKIIDGCTFEDLMRKRNVQGFYFSGIGIVLHVVEHYSYHVGQIALWTKILKDRDLGFYEGVDLTVRNKP